ncbi:MAG: DUF29 domain-containing protein [Crocosphaera sp.]|nr:DUF29 domain-containing protein [Crocosphaera sp.]
MTIITDLKSIYYLDTNQWLDITIKLLRENRLEELDLDHLIEELEELGRRDKLTVESFLEQIIRHLLLLEYWQEQQFYNANHWQAEIMSFRTQIQEYLTTNLRKHLEEHKIKVYKKALKYVRQKTGYSINFPEKCPYTIEQLIDEEWLP